MSHQSVYKQIMSELLCQIDMAVVLGGTTKYIQLADVSRNKPFADYLTHLFTNWLIHGEKLEI